MNYKFPSRLHLTTTQFRRVFNQRKQRISAKLCTIYYYENEVFYPRIGIVVPKKNVRASSKRNYFKRVVREIFRLNQDRLKSLDIVVVVKKEAADLTREEYREEIKKQINRLVHD